MADTMEGPESRIQIVQILTFLVPALMSLIAGLVIHSFIIGVNVTDWWKGRSVTPVDHIVTSLGISRMCAQGINTLFIFVTTLSQKNWTLYVIQAFLYVIYAFFTYSNFWLTSLLSIVLCLKISNLHTRLFLYLRRMILHRTLCFIVALVLVSAINCVMPMLITSTEMIIISETHNASCNPFIDCKTFTSLFSHTLGSFFPLLFYSISSVLLFTSLYHHTTRMKMSSNLSINLETYYSVMRFVSFTFIYNTTYLIAHYVQVFYYYFYSSGLPWLQIIIDFLPLLHSSYLIYKTAKLRDRMSKVLHNVTDFLFQRTKGENKIKGLLALDSRF